MVQLASGLRRRGHAIDLVLASAAGPYLSEVDADVNIVDLGRASVRAAWPGLVRYLREQRPSAALSTLHYSNIALMAAAMVARSGTRVYLREATTPTAVKLRPNDVKALTIRALLKVAYRAANGVIAVSNGVAQDLTDNLGLDAARVHTIYNPVVDEQLFAASKVELEDPWFGLENDHVLLAVGRLIADKDYASQLRALSRVREELDAGLVILGEGPERERLERLVGELGVEEHVRMPGFVGNPFAHMARASLFVLSSVREGLPGVLIQALACGCPVVSTDCRSGPSEILAGGKYGALVPVGDPAALADAITAALRVAPDRAALVARSLDFSSAASIQAYENLLVG